MKGVLSVLGKKRALDVLDFLESEPRGARFIDVQRWAVNGVPSVTTGLLKDLRQCGAVVRDGSGDLPRYRITDAGKEARTHLHQALAALHGARDKRQPRQDLRRRMGG